MLQHQTNAHLPTVLSADYYTLPSDANDFKRPHTGTLMRVVFVCVYAYFSKLDIMSIAGEKRKAMNMYACIEFTRGAVRRLLQ